MSKKINNAKTYLCVCLLLLSIACKKQQDNYSNINLTNQKVEGLYAKHLTAAIQNLDSISSKDVKDKKKIYALARKSFKLLEPILAYSDKNNFKSLNAPNILIVKGEESFDTKVLNPIGFQVIEETLYEEPLDTIVLKRSVNITSARLKLIKKNYLLKLKNYHLIWLLRDQITRIATTGITGFDSPALNQSLKESSYTYQTLIDILTIYKDNFKSKELFENCISSIKDAQKALDHDFDTFDTDATVNTTTYQDAV